MSRVLVTGAAGFIGSHLCDALLKEGHEVLGVESMLGGDLANLVPEVELCPADCCDLTIMKELMRGVDMVYHAAACPHEGLSVFSPVLISQHTYMSTVATATAAVHCGVKRLVFLSSMARYGKMLTPRGTGIPMAFTEDMLLYPVDPYGIAKVAAEQVCKVLGKAHGMEVVIAVPHNVYGPRQRYWDPHRNVAGIMINLMLRGRQPIIYGDGLQRRCFSYIGDCLGPLMQMGFKDGLDGEVFNIGPDENPVTIEQLGSLLARIIGIQYNPYFVKGRPCEVHQAWPSADKARRILGYRTTTTLEAGLRIMVDWIREKGPRPFEYHLDIELPDRPNLPVTWKERLF